MPRDELDRRFNDGYGIIFRSVMRDTSLSIGAKAVYAYLCTFAGNKKTAFPSRKLMCHELGINKDTLTKYMRNLLDAGYIKKEQKKVSGKFAHNVYTIYDFPESPSTENTVSENFRLRKFPTPKISPTNNNSNSNNNIDLNNTYIVENVKFKEEKAIPNPKTDDIEAITNNKDVYMTEIDKKQETEQIPYKEIVDYLNEKTGKQYRYTTPKTRELIKARWKEGFTLEDFKKVIDNKTLLWKGEKEEIYLRPVTLFGTKFESYLNEDPDIILKMKKKEKQKEEYNIQEFFDDLEIDYIIELTGNEYNAKRRFNEYAEKYGVDKNQRTLFKEFSTWCRKLRDGERV